MVDRVLITGGTGLLATNWAIAMRGNAEIFLVRNSRPIRLRDVNSVKVNLSQKTQIIKMIRDVNPDLIIHAAGLTDVDSCEKNFELAMEVNGEMAGLVAYAAADMGVKLVHISTDHLFDGMTPLLDEMAYAKPLNCYGKSKLLGEQLVANCNPDALIVRTNFYGWGNKWRSSISDWVLSNLRGGREINAYSDIYFTPILIDQLVHGVHQLVASNLSGVINMVGKSRLSKYDFACHLAKFFQLDERLVREASYVEFGFNACRPLDMSLNGSYARSILGSEFGSLEDGFIQLHNQESAGRVNELQNAIGEQFF